MGRKPQTQSVGEKSTAAMEIETDVANSDPRFSVNVLQLIKTAQSQHGLRHNDHTRYRKYCSARLRRLYKSLKFTHGRGKFSRRVISESTVTDSRFLHAVIYMAERAWSHAMEKKHESGIRNSKQRTYIISKFRKATKWADLLLRLCTIKADCRTSLEATAYASFMRGTLLLEEEKNWEMALKNFRVCKFVYEQLGKYGDVDNQLLCKNHAEEIEPNIRFCLYKLEQSNGPISDSLDLSSPDIPGTDHLKANLETVMAEEKTQNTSSTTDFVLLSRRFPMRNAKTRTFISRAQQLEKDLSASASGSTAAEKRLATFDKIFSAYHDARKHIRDDLTAVGDSEDAKVDLTGLDKAIGCVLLQRTMERNELLVKVAVSKISQQMTGVREGMVEKSSKPEELVRLFDTLIQNTTDLADLVTSGRDKTEAEEAYADELSAKSQGFRAWRCFYLAKSYSLSGKHTEAFALYCHARELTDSALQVYKNLNSTYESAMHELKVLSSNCRSEACFEHAVGVEESRKDQDKISDNIAAMSLSDGKQPQEKFLSDTLDLYQSAVGPTESKDPPRIAKFPPAFLAVPCKPIVLDTAANAITYPSLENHLKKEDKKGLFGRWWR